MGSTQSQLPDYGLDAPGLVRFFVLGGGALGLAGTVTTILAPAIGMAHAAMWMGGSFFLTGLLMWMSSRFGKLRARDALIDGLALRGHEQVLDVGCGRGLLLVGAAKRLDGGRAVGIDIWSERDLGGNAANATLTNARAEGVEERVEVVTGDMCAMPFEDGRFDAAVSCFAIHNVPKREDRRRAIAEVARVLAPGGRVAIQDLGRTGQYAADLRELGFEDVHRTFSPWTFPPSRVVRGTKPSRERT